MVSGVPDGGFDQTAQVMKSVLEKEKLVKRSVNILIKEAERWIKDGHICWSEIPTILA
ncbi:hypothetical protein ACEQPO_05750 [Bacillus sp. SL00103]